MLKEMPSVCPHCDKDVGKHFDVHEVLVHPEKRERFYPPEYIKWREEQKKSKKKKRSN